MITVKVILMLALGTIWYQDVKERYVYWFHFPVVALCSGLLFFSKTLPELFFTSLLINLFFVNILLLVVYLYSTFKLKTKFEKVFGLGDILLFLAIASSFSTLSFLVIFSSALFFSLALHLTTKSRHLSVPLAGYMSLFFGLIYLGYWSGLIQSVYQI